MEWAADALSRREGENSSGIAVTTVIPTWAQQIVSSYEGDEFIQGILNNLLQPTVIPQWELVGDILRYKGKITVGENTELRQDILRKFHNTALGGHSGVQGTYQRVKKFFYWPKMKVMVMKLIKTCEVCHRNKANPGLYHGLLQPLPIPDQAWLRISMDFVEGLPKSHDKDTILVVVHRLTKYGHFMALSYPFTVKDIAEVFLNQIYKLYGFSMSIVTDRDKIFTSVFSRDLFKAMGTSLDFTLAYHPQSDGQTKRLNQCLKNYLRCMCHQNPNKWASWLPLAEHWYNTNFHYGLRAFEALYGYSPPIYSLNSYLPCTEAEFKEIITQRQQFMQELKENLKVALGRMKYYVDKKREDREFEVGEWVYLKLAARYYGAYQIVERIGAVAYRLSLPEGSRVHPIFHISLLKKVISPSQTPATDLPFFDQDDALNLL